MSTLFEQYENGELSMKEYLKRASVAQTRHLEISTLRKSIEFLEETTNTIGEVYDHPIRDIHDLVAYANDQISEAIKLINIVINRDDDDE